MRQDYTLDDLRGALSLCGISTGDVVQVHVSLGRLGRQAGDVHSVESWAEALIDCVFDTIGPTGTLVVPTYTYSFSKREVFDVDNTPAAVGDFAEVFRRRSGAIRSRDPMLSHAAMGPAAERVVRNISRSCFGVGSVFDRLREHDAKICTIGVSLYYSTFLHHIEQAAEVPFRFVKPFRGVVREAGSEQHETWTYFAVPRHVPNCAKNSLAMERSVRAAGLVRIAPVGRGEVMSIGAQEFFDEGLRQFRLDPWLTAAGPPTSIERYAAAELAAEE